MKFDFLIIGAGYAGCVLAERLAAKKKQILIIDKRSHFGGNAYDEYDKNGVLVHIYGPHIFHTNSQRIFEYLSLFTEWRKYEHRVLSNIKGQHFPIPINLDTINQFYNLSLDEEGVKGLLEKIREPRDPIITSEDVVLNTVGRDLYESFFRGYTRKQWGLDPSQLSASVTARIPVRTNRDDRYFTDEFQAMPLMGYTQMFSNMLDNSHIKIELNLDYSEVKSKLEAKHIIYTGPIDTYFDYCFGKLPYRSLSFEHEYYPDIQKFQNVGTVNYPNEFSYTRITEFKHLTGQSALGTSIVKEYPQAEGDPYYPVPRQENADLYKKYEALASKTPNVTFVGRLAQYRYFNMDQVVGAALKTAETLG